MTLPMNPPAESALPHQCPQCGGSDIRIVDCVMDTYEGEPGCRIYFRCSLCHEKQGDPYPARRLSFSLCFWSNTFSVYSDWSKRGITG